MKIAWSINSDGELTSEHYVEGVNIPDLLSREGVTISIFTVVCLAPAMDDLFDITRFI